MDTDVWLLLAQNVVQFVLAGIGICMSSPTKKRATDIKRWLIFGGLCFIGITITGVQGYRNSQEKQEVNEKLKTLPTIAAGIQSLSGIPDMIQKIANQSAPLLDKKEGVSSSVLAGRNTKIREELAIFQIAGLGIQVECETNPKSSDEAIYESFRKWDEAFQKYAFSQLDKSYYSRFEDPNGLPIASVPLLATRQRIAVWKYVQDRQIRLQEFIREHKDTL